MIEWVLDNLAPIPDIDRVYVVTNSKFAGAFEEWAAGYKAKGLGGAKMEFTIVNDGSTCDDDKLGAIGDIHHVLKTQDIRHQDLLVVAGDNLFSQPVSEFAEAAKKHPATLAL